MRLDFYPETGAYALQVPRGEADLGVLMKDHGLDLSVPRSTPDNACLFTREAYAAVSFFEHAAPSARTQLADLHERIEQSWVPDSNRKFKVPDDKELWGFQRASLAYALDRTHSLIADEPGLGKTPMAIAYANEIQAQRVLVICPAAIRMQWARKIAEWTTLPWTRTIYTVLNGKYGIHPTANWTVISYDLARTEPIGKALAALKYDLLILDEAHYLKTIDSRRTRAIFGGGENRSFDPLVDKCDRVLALTGTPLPNRPREAYALARALCFDAIDWMSEDRFRQRFNPSKQIEVLGKDGQWKMVTDERSGRHAELQNRLRANFMVRHLKKDVMPQLNMPMFDIVQIEPTRAIKLALEAESLLAIDPEHLEGADMTVLGHIAAVRRQMGVAMAPSAADYVDMLLDGGERKLVVFGWHIEVLGILEAALAKWGVVRIDGSTSPKQRDHCISQFIDNPNINVIVGNLQSMGTGTDGLQLVSNHALIIEPDWTPANNVQAFDRLNRGGQTRTVQGDILVAPGSIAEKILAATIRKLNTTHLVLDERHSWRMK